MKQTMIQFFEWYLPADGKHWSRLKDQAQNLKQAGFTQVWMPPAYKGQAGKNDVGYGVYDMYDLGEFNQKGSVETKYGTKDEYLAAIHELHKHGLKAYGDIVFNHRMGADSRESVQVREVNPSNRNEYISGPYSREMWTKFDFPGRNGKYSDFSWNWTCFKGTDFNDNGRSGIVLFEGKTWDSNVSKEQGNFDFIMGNDVDFEVEYVLDELRHWGQWYQKETGLDGYRIDAVKSIDSHFFGQWLEDMKTAMRRKEPFAVGEFWSGDPNELKQYLEDCDEAMMLFDTALHYRLNQVSNAGGNYDIRNIMNDTLTAWNPDRSVAFVDNHDTQPGQALYSWVEGWFKSAAYALILLGFAKNPCVFYGDLYGIEHDGIGPVPMLQEMVWIRKNLLGDEVQTFLDEDPQKFAWLVKGEHPIACLFSIKEEKKKELQDECLKNRTLVRIDDPNHKVRFDEQGRGEIWCPGGGLGVYMDETDYDRMRRGLKDLDFGARR